MLIRLNEILEELLIIGLTQKPGLSTKFSGLSNNITAINPVSWSLCVSPELNGNAFLIEFNGEENQVHLKQDLGRNRVYQRISWFEQQDCGNKPRFLVAPV